jgi:drug/metabolite transporter (DMT)-like permease
MRRADAVRLVALGAIWGASFAFMRVLVPVLGPVWVAMLRVLIAGGALVLWFALRGVHADVRRHWRAYLFVGVVNSSVPFALFAFAAQTLPASYLAILNAATPLFGAVVSTAWLGERLTAGKLAGLALGALGVVLVSGAGPVTPDAAFAVAVAASLAAACCYAVAGVWLKKRGTVLPPLAVAGWSQVFAGAALAPLAAVAPMPGPLTLGAVGSLLALALLCSGAAYVLYYRLIADVGPTRAMTVTFLIPAFGMVWGALFLGETITLPMVAGALLVVAGTATVFRPLPLPQLSR